MGQIDKVQKPENTSSQIRHNTGVPTLHNVIQYRTQSLI